MTGLEVSPVAFGTWQLGGEWGRFDEDEVIAAIRRARELGVNLFDTAQGYGFGASVSTAGGTKRKRRRHQSTLRGGPMTTSLWPRRPIETEDEMRARTRPLAQALRESVRPGAARPLWTTTTSEERRGKHFCFQPHRQSYACSQPARSRIVHSGRLVSRLARSRSCRPVSGPHLGPRLARRSAETA